MSDNRKTWALIGGGILLILSVWTAVIYVAVHFIRKYW